MSSGKLLYREIKQSRQLNRTQSVNTQGVLQHDGSHQCTTRCVYLSVYLMWVMCWCFALYCNSFTWSLSTQHLLKLIGRGKSESCLIDWNIATAFLSHPLTSKNYNMLRTQLPVPRPLLLPLVYSFFFFHFM